MKRFGISYKSDSSKEIIMKITCNDLETAVKLVADIKQLSEEDICNIFHIEEIQA